MKKQLLYYLLVCFSSALVAQSSGWVFFSDKQNSTLSETYFDGYAKARKDRLGITYPTFSDLPVSDLYQAYVAKLADTLWGASRWLNAVAITATPAQWTEIARLPFVKETFIQFTGTRPTHREQEWPTLWESDSVLLDYQTRRLGVRHWQQAGITGKGVRVGVVDGGFKGVDEHPSFAHLRKEGRILATYDFLRQDSSVYGYSSHGTAVLSCIAGRYGDSLMIGLAPDAEVVLARTEYGIRENIQEELAWIQAIEWMDRFGVSIINASLGYTNKRYFQEDMDGRTSPIVRAANKAVQKGILIVNSSGNEGNGGWGTLGTPADGDSVLTVGATNPFTDIATSFSSPGPTADRRLKPNVTAPGIVVGATPKGMGETAGTSFSSPLVAGFAACLLQYQPQLTPMALLQAVEQAGHLYPYYDYHHGFGVPIASKALGQHTVDSSCFTIKPSGDYINFNVDKAYLPERDAEDRLLTTPKHLYYHIASADGSLRQYRVIAATEEEAYFIEKEQLQTGEILRVHFEGITKTYTAP